MMYANEENGQMQEDGMEKKSEVEKKTQDTTGQKERVGYKECHSVTHLTVFATVDAEESASTMFSISMMAIMTILAFLFKME